MSKQQGIQYAKTIINKCKERFGEKRVEQALQKNVRISDLEGYLSSRTKLK